MQKKHYSSTYSVQLMCHNKFIIPKTHLKISKNADNYHFLQRIQFPT